MSNEKLYREFCRACSWAQFMRERVTDLASEDQAEWLRFKENADAVGAEYATRGLSALMEPDRAVEAA